MFSLDVKLEALSSLSALVCRCTGVQPVPGINDHIFWLSDVKAQVVLCPRSCLLPLVMAPSLRHVRLFCAFSTQCSISSWSSVHRRLVLVSVSTNSPLGAPPAMLSTCSPKFLTNRKFTINVHVCRVQEGRKLHGVSSLSSHLQPHMDMCGPGMSSE